MTIEFLRYLTAGSAIWAAAALAGQVWSARSGRRPDLSRPAGSPAKGVWYNFTTAMLPWHKETARLHMVEFGAGVILHVGVLLTLVGVLVLLVAPGVGGRVLAWLGPVSLLSLAAGIGLLVRRMTSSQMRAISAPDDYLAIVVTCGLLIFETAFAFSWTSAGPLLAYTSLLLVYLPLGKLRHAVFFFLARADYGRRLGRRGVYPPAPLSGD